MWRVPAYLYHLITLFYKRMKCTQCDSRRSTIALIEGFNTLRPRQNGCRFANDTFKHIFLNENVKISIKISLKFVPKGPINNIPALVQITAWRRSGDKPLSEAMMVSLLTHICVTRPQWVNRSIWWYSKRYVSLLDCITWTLFLFTNEWNILSVILDIPPCKIAMGLGSDIYSTHIMLALNKYYGNPTSLPACCYRHSCLKTAMGL